MLVGTMLSAVMNFIGVYFLTNFLGPSDYGTIVWVIALMTSINSIADLGFDSAHIKRVSEGKKLSGNISTYITIKLVLIMIMVIIVAGSLVLWPMIAGTAISTETGHMIILFTAYFIFWDLTSIFSYTFLAREEIARYMIITLIDPLIRVPLTVYLAVNHASLTSIATAYVIGTITMFVVGLTIFYKVGIKLSKPDQFKNYLAFALPISTIAIITILSTNLDKVLIGLFSGSNAVGYYTSAFTLLLVISSLGGSVANVTFPMFSRLHTTGRLDEIKKITYQAERFISLIILPIILFIFFFPDLIITTLFGPNFIEAASSMRILVFAIFLNMINGIYLMQIYSFNRPKTAAKINLFWFFLNMSLLLIFVPDALLGIPMFGLSFNGAALAYLISVIVGFIITRIATFKLSGTSINKNIVVIGLIALVAGGATFTFQAFTNINGLIGIMVYSLTLLASYVSIMLLTRCLTKADIDYLLDVINIKKMVGYIRGEIKKEG